MKIRKVNNRRQYYWEFTDPATGKKREIRSYNRQELNKKIEIKKHELSLGEKGTQLFGDYLSEWLENVKARTIRPSSLERYRESVARIKCSDLGKIRMCDLDDRRIQHFYDAYFDETDADGKQIHMASAVKQFDKVIRPCINYAAARRDIDFDFMSIVVLPRDSAEVRRSRRLKQIKKKLSPDDQQKLTQYLMENVGKPREAHALMFLTQLYMGLRIGEALALTWRDVEMNPQGIFFHINKTFQRRKVKQPDGTIKTEEIIGEPKSDFGYRRLYVPDELVPLLEKHKLCQKKQLAKLMIPQTADTPIFATLSGAHKDYHNVNKTLKRICEKIGIPKHSSHDLRHTFSTNCMEAGVPEKVIQEWMGDASIQVIRGTYQSVRDNIQRMNMQKVTSYIRNENCAKK